MPSSFLKPSARSARTPGLLYILVTVWIDVLSWGVTLPVYPRLIQKFTHGDVTVNLYAFSKSDEDRHES